MTSLIIGTEFCRGHALAGSTLKNYRWPPKNMPEWPPGTLKIRAMHRRYENYRYLGRIHWKSVLFESISLPWFPQSCFMDRNDNSNWLRI